MVTGRIRRRQSWNAVDPLVIANDDVRREPVVAIGNWVVDPVAVVVHIGLGDLHSSQREAGNGLRQRKLLARFDFFTCIPVALTPTTLPLFTSAKTSAFPAV